jgi:hypothetical protein
MSAGLLPSLVTRFLDGNGEPLVGGKLYSYAAGTSTPKATYTDDTMAGVNPNPIILDSNGEASVWLSPDKYKFVLKSPTDVVLWTRDNVSNLYDQSVDTFNLIDGSVTTIKLADNSVSTAKIQGSAVTTAKIADGAVTTAKLPTDVLSADTAGRLRMSDGFVTTPKILDENVTLSKLPDGVLTADTAGRAKMVDGFVTTAKIADANVTGAKVATNTIQQNRLQSFAGGQTIYPGSTGTGGGWTNLTTISVPNAINGRTLLVIFNPFSPVDYWAPAASGQLLLRVTTPVTVRYVNFWPNSGMKHPVNQVFYLTSSLTGTETVTIDVNSGAAGDVIPGFQAFCIQL